MAAYTTLQNLIGAVDDDLRHCLLWPAAWAHHSAISAGSRRETETAIREAPRGSLVATSTFELGIDIGDLDRVVQIDAPATVRAMVQRLGRTGRRPGTESRMTFLARKTEPLVLALALLRLHAQG